MSSKTLAIFMKIVVVLSALFGLLVCIILIPSIGNEVIGAYPEFSSWYWPWIAFAWIFSVPCFVILVDIWIVSDSVKDDTVFTLKTAKTIRSAVILLITDAAILFTGNVVLLMVNMNHPSVMLISFVVAIAEIIAALFAEILTRYITKASLLQEESDGTI